MEQMKMNPWTLSVLLLLAGPLGADPDWHVEYPDSFCVVEGSTATIPCSFTHPTRLRVERVVWCPDHEICQGSTPNVYDSSNVRADSRFLYLGDRVGNCTLKINKTEKQDAATYRFRIETNGEGYAGRYPGVTVTVTDGEDVKVRSSVTDNVVKEGGQVTLTCTSACSFHQLDVHWYRNGHALSETGPALHLSCLTNDDTGNYTCSLDSSGQKTSAPWRLVVEDEDGEVVKVRSSVTDNVVKEGGQVTLTCTSNCSFHQLDVHWYRNGHALSETGPALRLSSLTNDNTGNYTCSLNSSGQKTSAPWSLVVEEDEGKQKSNWRLIVPVVLVLLAVFLLLLAGLVFAKRRHAQNKSSGVIQKQEVDRKQEAVGASEEVSYSTVHFKPSSSRSAPGPEHEIVYSEVVR